MEFNYQKKVFEKHLDSLIEDFSKKKNKYKKKYSIISIIIIIINSAINFTVGISINGKYDFVFKVVSLLLNSIVIIFNGILAINNYRDEYEQRTTTLVKLLFLKREYEFYVKNNNSKEKIEKVFDELQEIMGCDLNNWKQIINNKREKGYEKVNLN